MGSNPFVATIYGDVLGIGIQHRLKPDGLSRGLRDRGPPSPPLYVRVVQWIGLQITNLAIRVRLPA